MGKEALGLLKARSYNPLQPATYSHVGGSKPNSTSHIAKAAPTVIGMIPVVAGMVSAYHTAGGVWACWSGASITAAVRVGMATETDGWSAAIVGAFVGFLNFGYAGGDSMARAFVGTCSGAFLSFFGYVMMGKQHSITSAVERFFTKKHF